MHQQVLPVGQPFNNYFTFYFVVSEHLNTICVPLLCKNDTWDKYTHNSHLISIGKNFTQSTLKT